MSFKVRLATVAGAAAVAALVAPTAAHAAAGDIVGAELTNMLDQVAAASVSADPDVTCDVKAGGRDTVQHTNYVVGEVYGEDLGEGSGECASLNTARTYTVTLKVQLEYFTAAGLTTGIWKPIPGCGTTTIANSVDGVAVPVPAVTTCTYTSTSGFLNRYHRAHATLAPAITGAVVRHAYSPTWFMAP
jgi:hypothetical protein